MQGFVAQSYQIQGSAFSLCSFHLLHKLNLCSDRKKSRGHHPKFVEVKLNDESLELRIVDASVEGKLRHYFECVDRALPGIGLSVSKQKQGH